MNVVRANKQWQQAGKVAVGATPPPVPVRASKKRFPHAIKSGLSILIPPLLGGVLFLLLWAQVSTLSGLPGPIKTWVSAVEIFSDPFYQKGPNDQGIGWNVLHSLARVGMGFGLAALLGIPLGFMIGRFVFLNKMTAPIISLLRPVSPLAWLPIGLYVFKEAQPAAICWI